MRIRTPFAFAFLAFSLGFAYLGFSKVQLKHDKMLHFLAFFILSATFYWVLEAPRKRCINLTLFVCAFVGGIGSEFVQGLLPYRDFDINDIYFNIGGSLSALLLNSWYHKRQLERKRTARYEQLRAGLSSDAASVAATDHNTELADLEARIETSTADDPRTNEAADSSDVLLQEVEPQPIK